MEFTHLVNTRDSIMHSYTAEELVKKTVVRYSKDATAHRFYVFSSKTEFEHWYMSRKSDMHFHEVIFGHQVQRLKFDIDCTSTSSCINDGVIESEFDEVLDTITTTIIQVLNSQYEQHDLYFDKSELIITSSSGWKDLSKKEYKHSYHIILWPVALLNNIEAAHLTGLVKTSLPEAFRPYLDTGVNKSIQNFRLLHSTKDSSSSRVKRLVYPTLSSITLLDTMIVPFSGIKVLPRLLRNEAKLYANLGAIVATSSANDKNVNRVLNCSSRSSLSSTTATNNTTTINVDTCGNITNTSSSTPSYDSGRLSDVVQNILALVDTHYPDLLPPHRLRAVNGKSIEFDRISPSHCILCNRTHDHDNTLILYVSSKHGVYECCRKVLNDLPPSSSAAAFYASARQLLTPTTTESNYIKTQPKNLFASLSTRLVYSAPTMRPYDITHHTLAVKAQMKLGKTKALLEYVKTHFNDSTTTIRFITFRQTFSNQIHDQFNMFQIYTDIKGPITTAYKKVIIQVESLFRLSMDDGEAIDLLILDEIESILNQFSSGLHKHFNHSFAMFVWMLRTAKHVVCMDANMSNRTYNILTKFRPNIPIFYHCNEYKSAQSDKYFVTLNKDLWFNRMLSSLAQSHKLVIPTNSINAAKTCEKVIQEAYPSVRVRTYSSEMEYSEKQIHFNNVHKYWSEIDVLIYTPTCSAGVSFELKYYDVVFGYFTNMSCDVETCRQMLYRVRSISSNQYYICLEEIKVSRLPVSTDELSEYMRYKRESMYLDANLQFQYDGCGRLKFYETDYYFVWLETSVYLNSSKNDFIRKFVEQVKESGASVGKMCNNDDEDNSHYSFDEYKAMVKMEKCDSIAGARDLTLEEKEEIVNRASQQMNVRAEERIAIEKYNLRKLYRFVGPMTCNFVKLYSQPTVQFIFKNLCKIAKLKTIEESVKALVVYESERFKYIVNMPVGSNRMQMEYYDLNGDGKVYSSLLHIILSKVLVLFEQSGNRVGKETFEQFIDNVLWPTILDHRNYLTTELMMKNTAVDSGDKNRVLNKMVASTYGLKFKIGTKTIKIAKKDKDMFAFCADDSDVEGVVAVITPNPFFHVL